MCGSRRSGEVGGDPQRAQCYVVAAAEEEELRKKREKIQWSKGVVVD